MKNLKNLYPIAIFVFAIVFVLAGCKKEEVTTDSKINDLATLENSRVTINKRAYPLKEISVVNGTMQFKSVKQYDDVLAYLNKIGDNNFDKFEKAMGFNSFRSSVIDKSEFKFHDNLFFTILDSKGQIIIENKIYRMDFVNEVVYATDINSQRGNITTKHSFDEDILNSSAATRGLFGKDVKATVTGNTPWLHKYDIKVCYQASGVYFSIIVKITKGTTWGGFDCQAISSGSAIPKNRSRVSLNGTGAFSQRESEVRPYGSSRSLTSYDCTGTFYEQSSPALVWTLYNAQ